MKTLYLLIVATLISFCAFSTLPSYSMCIGTYEPHIQNDNGTDTEGYHTYQTSIGDNQTYIIKYKISSNATLENIGWQKENPTFSIIVREVQQGGNLTIQLPTKLLGPYSGGYTVAEGTMCAMMAGVIFPTPMESNSNLTTVSFPLMSHDGVRELIIITGNHATPESLSPLKQFKSGVKAEDVKCDSNFILAINRNYSPACLTESSAEKLLLRGWALGFTHYRAVYFVKPDSTSQISVQYEPLNFKDQTPPDLAMQLNSRIYKSNSSYPTNEINATARPDLIHTQLITIVNYTVTTSDTTGVYWLSLAYQCNLIPIAVGIDPLQMAISNLQDPSTSISCPPSETQFHVSGISNATLKLIRVD